MELLSDSLPPSKSVAGSRPPGALSWALASIWLSTCFIPVAPMEVKASPCLELHSACARQCKEAEPAWVKGTAPYSAAGIWSMHKKRIIHESALQPHAPSSAQDRQAVLGSDSHSPLLQLHQRCRCKAPS